MRVFVSLSRSRSRSADLRLVLRHDRRGRLLCCSVQFRGKTRRKISVAFMEVTADGVSHIHVCMCISWTMRRPQMIHSYLLPTRPLEWRDGGAVVVSTPELEISQGTGASPLELDINSCCIVCVSSLQRRSCYFLRCSLGRIRSNYYPSSYPCGDLSLSLHAND